MRIREAFPTKYLASEDVSSDLLVNIRSVRVERVGKDETKPIIYFRELRKGMVLNKTNGLRLEASLGGDTDDWVGHQVTLYVDPAIQFQGKTVKGLRVRVDGAFVEERRPPTANETAVAAQQPLGDLDDEIPF